jgi:hypothetical protein
MDYSGKADAELCKMAEPIWENMILGFNEENYETFSKDFSKDMLKDITQEVFKNQIDDTLPTHGEISSSKTFLGCIHRTTGVSVLWKSHLSLLKGEVLVQLTLDDEEGQLKVFSSFIG